LYVIFSSIFINENLFFELKFSLLMLDNFSLEIPSNCSFIASIVILLSSIVLIYLAKISNFEFFLSAIKLFSFSSNMSNIFILLFVIVPVLSTHKTSTLARLSILFISCRITFFLASFPALIAKATVVNKYKPSGIIPINADTIELTLSL